MTENENEKRIYSKVARVYVEEMGRIFVTRSGNGAAKLISLIIPSLPEPIRLSANRIFRLCQFAKVLHRCPGREEISL